jgi:phage terminase large subunit
MRSKVVSLNFRPRAWQEYALNKMAIARFCAIVMHRRGGKTFFSIGDQADKLIHCPHKNPVGLYAALTYSQAKKIAFQYYKDFFKDFPGFKASEKDLTVEFSRASDIVKIYLAGTENIDSLRGPYADDAILDEYAFQPKSIYDKLILPMLSDRSGSLKLISSVNGRNDFYNKYQEYKQNMINGDKNYFALNLHAYQSGALSQSEIEIMKKAMSDEAFRQEMMNDFGAGDSSTYYGSYMERVRDEGRVTRVPYDPMYAVDVFFDLGMNDSTSVWFRQMVGREFRYINYLEESGRNIPYWVSEIRKLGYSLGKVVLPHDAAQREFSTGKTRQEAFRECGLLTEIQPRQKVEDRIEAVRNHLPKCVFDADNCNRGLICLENYRKKWDDRNGVYTQKPVHNEYSHGADCFGYAALDESPSYDEIQIRRRQTREEVAESSWDVFGGY